MPTIPAGFTDEQVKYYEKQQKLKDILSEIARDYSLPKEVGYMAEDIRSFELDITSEEELSLLVRKDPVTGELRKLGIKPITELTKENVMEFLKSFYSEIKGPEDPIYNFARLITDPRYGRKINLGRTRVQTDAFDINKTGPEADKQREFIQQNKELLDKLTNQRKGLAALDKAIQAQRTIEDDLEDDARKEAENRQCVEVASGRSNALLGRHANYVTLSQNSVKQYDGIPVAGLALLVGNSRNINRNIEDGSSGQIQNYSTMAELTPEEKKIAQAVDNNQELINIGAKVLDSLYGGNDITRMGNRATVVVESRKALNDALAKYTDQQNPDRKPLADLIADSFEVVYSQIFFTKDKITAAGAGAIAEMYHACEELFSKDPELKRMTGITDKQMQELKGATAVYEHLANPKQKMLDAYKKDQGPKTPERSKLLDDILFRKYLELNVVENINRNNTELGAQHLEEVDNPEYQNLFAKYQESEFLFKDALASQYVYENRKVPLAFEILGKHNISIDVMKDNILNRIRNTAEYKQFMFMDKDELFKQNFTEFVSKVVNKDLDVFEKNQKQAKAEELKKQNEAKLPKEEEISAMWYEIANDFSVPENISNMAAHFAKTRLDITNRAQLDLIARRDPKTGEYASANLPAAIDLNKEYMLDFLYAVQETMQGEENAIYDFGTLATRENGISAMFIDGDGKFDIRTKLVVENEPMAPASQDDPGFFKNLANKWFGAYKDEVNNYKNYTRELAAYNKYLSDKPINDAAKMKFKNSNKKLLESKTQFEGFYTEKRLEQTLNKTREQKLNEAVAEEQQRFECVELASGRSHKLLGRHKNYEELAHLELDDVVGLPMNGLALLVANSLTINKNVSDASTQIGQKYNTSTPFTKDEQQFVDLVSKNSQITNVSAKIMESLYCGKDVYRMGDRATSVVESRKLLNVAAQKYMEGDEQPLADLINDSIDVFYSSANSIGSRIVTGQGKAISEMYKALEKVFAQDPEFRKQIKITDEQMNIIKGTAKVYDIIAEPKKRALEAFKMDEGPGSNSRQELLDDILFKSYLESAVKKECLMSTASAATEAFNVLESDFVNKFYNKIPDKGQRIEFSKAVQAGLAEKYYKPSMIFQTFAKDDLNLETVKNDMLADIKKSPEYEKLLKMDKNELYQQDFLAITDEIADTRAKEYQTSLKQQPDKIKQNNQLDLDQNSLNQQVNPTAFVPQ